MKIMQLVVLGAVIMVMSGCAGRQTRQELARLQSQVGLLDERLSQIERMNVSGSSASSWTETGTAGESAAGGVARTAGPSAAGAGSSSASMKPTSREIQQALKNAGFYQGVIDGKVGPKTRDAIKEFQRVHGLTDDGVVGKQTWAKLHPYAELSSSSSGEATAAEPLK